MHLNLTHHFCIGDAAVALEGAGVLGGLDVPAATVEDVFGSLLALREM